jgi:hypothetical protein
VILLSFLLLSAGAAAPERLFLPLIGGDSDVGLVFGGLAVISAPGSANEPFAWQATVQTSTSVKIVDEQLTMPLQRHFIRFEKPRIFADIRLWAEVRFDRLISAGYFGLGDGGAGAVAAPPKRSDYQYDSVEPLLNARLSAPFSAAGHWGWVAGLMLKWLAPSAYPGSILAADIGAEPRLRGAAAHLGIRPLVALRYDNRDDRFWPRCGGVHLLSLRGEPGFMAPQLRFVAGTILMRQFVPLGGDMVFAARLWLDAIVGTPAFPELAVGGDLRMTRMIGHGRALRGIPWGRVHAPYKAIGSLELRRIIRRFGAGSRRTVLSLTGFIEAGRGWWDAGASGEAAWSIGGGPRLNLGRGVLLRLDFAHAAAASALRPGLFTGVYFDLQENF